MLLNQRTIDKQKVKEKYSNKIQAETDKMSKELESKLRRQREILQVHYDMFIYFILLLFYIINLLNIYLESSERKRR